MSHASLEGSSSRPGEATTPAAAPGIRAGGESPGRRPGVDLLRGLAILTMVAANTAGEIVPEPHPFGIRLYGSFAAPLFIALSGMMVARAARDGRPSPEGRRHDGRYFLIRGALLLLTAILVDALVASSMPLVAFDVLYVIGFSLPLAYLLARRGPGVQAVIPASVFAASPLLQGWWGYRAEIDQPPLGAPIADVLPLLPLTWKRFLIDGWFPVFPWLGFSLFGVFLEARGRRAARPKWDGWWLGIVLLLVGAVLIVGRSRSPGDATGLQRAVLSADPRLCPDGRRADPGPRPAGGPMGRPTGHAARADAGALCPVPLHRARGDHLSGTESRVRPVLPRPFPGHLRGVRGGALAHGARGRPREAMVARPGPSPALAPGLPHGRLRGPGCDAGVRNPGGA
jgi:uncharacterized membrane protein